MEVSKPGRSPGSAMNTIDLQPPRYHLTGLLLLVLSACGGSGGAGPTSDVPAPGNPPPQPPPPVVVLEDALADHAFVSDHFSGSQNCAFCHDGLRDSSGLDVSIVAEWQASMMANSSRDPVWRAKVASEIKRNPNLREEIESTCSRCHAPMAHVEAVFATAEIRLMDDGFLHPDNPLFDAAADGVSCTLCHQVSDSADLGTDAGFSGNFEIPFVFGSDRVAFGQYSNPLAGPMVNQVAFTPTTSGHISESEVCGTCHNLSTPVVDAQGNLTNDSFPEQMVYTEWEHSDFATTRSCQDCHMIRADGDVTISTRPMNGGLRPRPEFARHNIVGGNTYLLDILARNAGDLQISATGFDDLIADTRAFLGGAVSLGLEDVQKSNGELHFSVRLSNHSGHKFPTSYPSRRAWLQVIISDAQGVVMFESGAVDASGQITGHAGDLDRADVEPHYQTIRSESQVQSYETVMENADQNVTHTLLEARAYRKDNRLLPAGMDKASVPDTIRPQGAAFGDPDFIGGSDVVHYEIAGLVPGTYTIEAKLNYQTLAYGFIQDLIADDDEARVALFRDLDHDAVTRVETIAIATGSID